MEKKPEEEILKIYSKYLDTLTGSELISQLKFMTEKQKEKLKKEREEKK